MFIANEMLATIEIGSVEGGDKLIEKYKKLLKIGKLSKNLKLFKSKNLKSKKSFKSQKWAKLKKKLLKSKNSPKFDIKENKPSFLTPNVRMAFNYLRLTLIKALIFQHFNLKYYI